MELEEIYQILNNVLPNKVFYAVNVYDNESYAELPYIVYQEISKRAHQFLDDVPHFYYSNIQITLVSKKKDRNLERKLRNEVDYILIGDKVRRKLYLWIKDTLTEEVEVEKEFIRKKKWRN